MNWLENKTLGYRVSIVGFPGPDLVKYIYAIVLETGNKV